MFDTGDEKGRKRCLKISHKPAATKLRAVPILQTGTLIQMAPISNPIIVNFAIMMLACRAVR
jgi:hypothetical protein